MSTAVSVILAIMAYPPVSSLAALGLGPPDCLALDMSYVA